VIEMALGALGVPHGTGGVGDAIAWLGKQVAYNAVMPPSTNSSAPVT
jgi:hypothetical protein